MQARVELDAIEARVIGCLMEKQVTTPDQYPLSLNALVAACNQKSNRDPLLSLAEAEVQRALDALAHKHVVLERGGFGSRVSKYQHCFCNTEFGTLRFSPLEFAIVCELLVRGPQTPGELRTRAARMAEVHDAGEVESALAALAERAEGPVVRQLPREPGRRDSRWAQLFTPLPEGALAPAAAAAGLPTGMPPAHAAGTPPARASDDALLERIGRLEEIVDDLQRQLDQLRNPRE